MRIPTLPTMRSVRRRSGTVNVNLPMDRRRLRRDPRSGKAGATLCRRRASYRLEGLGYVPPPTAATRSNHDPVDSGRRFRRRGLGRDHPADSMEFVLTPHFRPHLASAACIGLVPLIAGGGQPIAPRAQRPVVVRWAPEVEVAAGPGAGELRAEPSVTIADSVVVTAWNDSYGGAHGSETGVAAAWAISYDSGATFAFGGYLPASDGLVPSGADTWLAHDPAGGIYLQVVTWQHDFQAVLIYAMPHSQRGRWLPPSTAIKAKEVDKPVLVVADSSRMAVVYTSHDSIALVRSDGRGWTLPSRLSGPPGPVRLGSTLAWCAHSLLAAWMEGTPRGGLTDLVVVASADDGRSFSAPLVLYHVARPVSPPSGYAFGVGPAGFIANNAWASCRGRTNQVPTFYLTVTEGTPAGDRLVLFEGTIDRIAAARPTPIGASPDSVAKVFPAIAVVGDMPAILYYNRRLAPRTSMTDVFLSVQERGGGFSDFRVTERSTDWDAVAGDRQAAPIQRNFGDYISLATDGDRLAAAWTDGRSGHPRIMSRIGRLTP
jgi:hypothetical protein